jgi:hypothetical protein
MHDETVNSRHQSTDDISQLERRILQIKNALI